MFRNFYFLCVVLIVLPVQLACNEKKATSAGINQSETEQISAIVDSTLKLKPREGFVYWKQIEKEGRFKTQPGLALVNYHQARYMAPISLDSSKIFIGRALELIANTNGNLLEKMIIYNGAGNLAHALGMDFQAAYYYNQSASIIMADTGLGAKPKAKVICLVNAAQANEGLSQYEKAIKQNKAALEILKNYPDTVYLHRANSQLFSNYSELNMRDSLAFYLKEVERYTTANAKPAIVRATLGQKEIYFTATGMLDSAIHFGLASLKLDSMIALGDRGYDTAGIFTNNYIENSNLLNLYLAKGDLVKAGLHLRRIDEAEKTYHQRLHTNQKVSGAEARMKYFFATGNTAAAKSEAERLIALKESMLKEAGVTSMNEMSALYELQIKERSIHNLTHEVDVQAERLDNNKLWMIIIGLLALFGLSLAALFYARQKNKRIWEEKEKAHLQQQLLRTQMEPHFIFNTISALQSFIRFDEKEKSIKYLNRFSKLLRNSLELSRQELVPLEEELETLRSYLDLQQMRLEKNFEYSLNLPDGVDLTEVKVPPMLIQPFVENAIIHGLGKKEEGRIDIDFVLNKKNIHVTISDNGEGFLEEKPGNGNSQKSLSGIIARERLEILGREMNAEAGIQLHSNIGKGTVVELLIPCVNETGR